MHERGPCLLAKHLNVVVAVAQAGHSMWPLRPSAHSRGRSRGLRVGVKRLPNVCCQTTSRFGHLCSACSTVCLASIHSGYAGSAAVSNKYALRIAVYFLIVGWIGERHLPGLRRLCSPPSRMLFCMPWPFGACRLGDK